MGEWIEGSFGFSRRPSISTRQSAGEVERATGRGLVEPGVSCHRPMAGFYAAYSALLWEGLFLRKRGASNEHE